MAADVKVSDEGASLWVRLESLMKRVERRGAGDTDLAVEVREGLCVELLADEGQGEAGWQVVKRFGGRGREAGEVDDVDLEFCWERVVACGGATARGVSDCAWLGAGWRPWPLWRHAL